MPTIIAFSKEITVSQATYDAYQKLTGANKNIADNILLTMDDRKRLKADLDRQFETVEENSPFGEFLLALDDLLLPI